jgi:hypothetical protein
VVQRAIREGQVSETELEKMFAPASEDPKGIDGVDIPAEALPSPIQRVRVATSGYLKSAGVIE